MDSKGNIHQYLDDEQREALEKHIGEQLKEIPPDEVEQLKVATQEARIKWYQRRAYNAPPVGLDADDAQKAKNAAKRERRERDGK